MRRITDEAIILAARSGDRAAMERLIEAAWPHAYRLAYAAVRERAQAEDIAQESCAIVWRTLDQLRAPSAFLSWLYRIVSRESRRAPKRTQGLPAEPSVGSADPDVDTTIVVDRALQLLNHRDRLIVVLTYHGSCNSAEIGAILGMPAATVRFRLAVAKRRLRTDLAPLQEAFTHA